MSTEHTRVPVERLTAVCDSEGLGFETTADVSPLEGTIGQERAMSAIELGLDIEAPGFNLFVSGAPGTGRNTALRSYLERIAVTKSNPPDWGYVFNFRDPTQPVPIHLSCGMMLDLAHDMDELIETCQAEIPAAFESDDYTHRVEEVMAEIGHRRQTVTDDLEAEARQRGFTVSVTQVGMTPVPLHPEGRPLTQDEFSQLPEEAQVQLRAGAEGLQYSIRHAMSEFRRLGKEAGEIGQQVDVELVSFTLKPIIDELQEKYSAHEQVVTFLDEVEADMVSHTAVFKVRGEAQATPTGADASLAGPADAAGEGFFARYRVNDLVDNTFCNGAPVEFEDSPTYYNLFGRIDYRARMGALSTDHMMIKSGALHRANGGYLVVQAKDLLVNPLSWDTLKRVLRSGEMRIENIGEQHTPLPTTSMRPLPIPVSAKVVLVGGPEILRMLQAVDEDFRRYFKVNADFDTVMDRTPENIGKYASFVAAQVEEGGLLPFDRSAVAAVVDYSSRLVEDQNKLTTRFMHVSDVLNEADYWSRTTGNETVTADHVAKAIEQRAYRAGLTEDRLLEAIENDTIHIDTKGAAIGQVNGLAVYSLGDHSFGRPSRITARVSVGNGRVVNIDRETRMSGRIHNKGFMIISGYIQGKYGGDRPLSMSASLTFEQSYTEVDGDSASSTELYALLSELSGVPIRQGIAVTGSVNQTGEVQAIGGATHKIEGFLDVCRTKGLTGDQGVMIPKDNVRNLVLDPSVVDAVRDGEFHVYAVSTIDEGIEVLTGVEAGQKDENGSYPEGTIHFLVERRLEEMARKSREAARSRRDEDEDETERPSTV